MAQTVNVEKAVHIVGTFFAYPALKEYSRLPVTGRIQLIGEIKQNSPDAIVAGVTLQQGGLLDGK